MGNLSKIALTCLAVGMLIVGVVCLRFGFAGIENVRLIERIPRMPIGDVIPVEANISGHVDLADGQRLRAPDSRADCVYFRYTLERRERDRQGNQQWRHERTTTRKVPFLIADPSGSITVEPCDAVSIRAVLMHERTDGNTRHTEYRIDPGMTVFATGRVHREEDSNILRFSATGAYRPIISATAEGEERGLIVLQSIVWTLVGLMLISLFVYVVTRVVGIHHILAYLVIVTLALAFSLLIQADRMMRNDLRAAYSRLQNETEVRINLIQGLLAEQTFVWDGDWRSLGKLLTDTDVHLSQTVRYELTTHRVAMARALHRARALSDRFPERWVAASMDLEPIPDIPLLPDEQRLFDRYESTFADSRIPAGFTFLMILAGLVGAGVLGTVGFRLLRIKRWIETVSTVRPAGVVYGINEIKGVADLTSGAEPLRAPLSGEPCVYYHYVEEERQGDRGSRWAIVKNHFQGKPFVCRDAEGEIPIDPSGSQWIIKTKLKENDGHSRYTEHRLPIGAPIYILGNGIIDPRTHNRLIVSRGSNRDQPYIISDYSESELIARKAMWGFLSLNLGLTAFMAAAFGIAAYGGSLSPAAYMFAAMMPMVYLGATSVCFIYNDMVYLRWRCETLWANIDVSLKKRFDLISRVATVAEKYLKHEKAIQTAVTTLRALPGRLSPAAAARLIDTDKDAVRNLIAKVEAYPELKSDELLRGVTKTIRDTEDEIALMREGYNNAVETYNTRIGSFPDVLLARFTGFQRREFFRAVT